MVRQFDLAALRRATAPATWIRITIAIHTRNIQSHPIRQNLIRRTPITRSQNMMAEETGIAVILTQAPRATLAALALHNTDRTTTQDRRLLALAAAPDRLLIPARRPDQVRLLDLGHPTPRRPILLLVQTLRRTQATTHRPDQAAVRRLHLPRRRIPAAVVRHDK